MSSKTHQTAVVLVPTKDCWDPIQQVREEHDAHMYRWMPHITLLYPFVKQPLFDEVEARLREQLRLVEPFEVTLNKFRHFHHVGEYYTLWLEPEPKESLMALQGALESAMPECDDVSQFPDGFTPHLSVGQAKGEAVLKKLEAELQLAWEPLNFMAEEVTLIYRGQAPDDIFRVDRNIPLGR
jgi:poly(A) polymerase